MTTTDYGRPVTHPASLEGYPPAVTAGVRDYHKVLDREILARHGIEVPAAPTPAVPGVADHEGRKYLRRIDPADGTGDPILVDIYAVLTAFGVTCPAVGHAVKKLLAAGRRGKGSAADDLRGALAAVSRAVELELVRGATR